jgi:hypothetical protein
MLKCKMLFKMLVTICHITYKIQIIWNIHVIYNIFFMDEKLYINYINQKIRSLNLLYGTVTSGFVGGPEYVLVAAGSSSIPHSPSSTKPTAFATG